MTDPRRSLALARRDVRESARDRSLYALVAFFGLMGIGFGVLHGRSAGAGTTGGNLLSLLTLFFLFLVPLSALTGAYESVVGMRSDGSLKLVLALPYARGDVVAGTYAGRVVFVLAPLATAVVLAHLVGLAMGAPLAPVAAVLFVALTLPYAVAFVGLAVGVSTATRSTTRAAAIAFGVFLVSVALWDLLVDALAYVVNGFSSPAARPEWARVLVSVNPRTAYQRALSGFVGELSGVGLPGEGPRAFYQEPAFAVLALLGWAVLVPIAGYLRFRGADL